MHFDDAPVLGGGDFLGHMSEMRADPLHALLRFSAECGDIARLRVPGATIGIVNSPAYVHEVLVAKAKSFEKSPVLRSALMPLAGSGLFTSEGELWRKQRKLMAPLFQQQQIERYAECMRTCAEQVADRWQDGATIDVARETTRIAMSVAGRALFDADTEAEADAIGEAITTALHWVNDESASYLMLFKMFLRNAIAGVKDDLPESVRNLGGNLVSALEKPTHLPGERSRKLREALAVLDARVERMIADRRAEAQERSDLLTRLLKARDEDDGSRMSDKQVRDEVVTLFIAGHETTAAGLAWAFYLLGRSPEHYRKVRAEVDALGGRPAGFADLPALGVCLQVFKESLRLYPPIFLFGRQAIADVQVGDYLVPKMTVLLVCPYALQHRADVWPDPDRFDPDRFLPAAEAARHRDAFLPFSAGPRTCIGNHFALMEGPIVMATLLQRADLERTTEEPVVPEASATLRPKGGIAMRVRTRAR
jgi:cytochrome P450